MNGDIFLEIIGILGSIEKDESISKGVRIKIKNTIESLNNENISLNIRIDRSLEELGSISEDPNVPNYARTQILSLVSLLESRE